MMQLALPKVATKGGQHPQLFPELASLSFGRLLSVILSKGANGLALPRFKGATWPPLGGSLATFGAFSQLLVCPRAQRTAARCRCAPSKEARERDHIP